MVIKSIPVLTEKLSICSKPRLKIKQCQEYLTVHSFNLIFKEIMSMTVFLSLENISHFLKNYIPLISPFGNSQG